jgi:inosine-uridine nucleoside N-ribohydrolase
MASAPDSRSVSRIVSTDAGIDDALALLFIAHFADPPVEAIIATGGNVPVAHVAANCAHLRDRFGLRGALFAGTDPPPTGGARDASHVHGPTGLGAFRSPPVELPALEQLAGSAEHLAAIDLLVLGPATDAALLLRDERTGPRIRSVTLMGGAFEPRGGTLGNVTPWAEFNAYMDPAALGEVAASVETGIVPLDATEQRLFTADELADPTAGGGNARFVRGMIEFLAHAHVALGCGSGVYMHDAIAAAVWLGLIQAEWRKTGLAPVVADGERRGLIRADDASPVRIRYTRRVDMDGFLALWREVAAAL